MYVGGFLIDEEVIKSASNVFLIVIFSHLKLFLILSHFSEYSYLILLETYTSRS